MTEVSPAKKLSQTKISSFFSGSSTIAFLDQKLSVNRRKTKKTKRMSHSTSVNGEKSPSKPLDRLCSLNLLAENLSVANIPKRKLPAPIFSDNEDDSGDDGERSNPRSQAKGNTTTPTKPKILMQLNKPSPLKCRKVCENSENLKPLSASTPLPLESQKRFTFPQVTSVGPKPIKSEEIPSCSKSKSFNGSSKDVSKAVSPVATSKTVKVLQNVVVHSPAKKSVLAEEENSTEKKNKKANFDQLKVFREFFINVLKNNCLKILINDHDRDLLQKFFGMERNYQYVCIKLFLWKSTWYNIFQYVEKIGLQMEDNEVTEMYKYLRDNGFVETEYMCEDTFTLLNLLGLKDIRDIMRSFLLTNTRGVKESLITKLLQFCKTQITLHTKNAEEVLREKIKEKMGFCVKLSSYIDKCLYHAYLLNTFTNSTLTEPQDYFKNVSYFNIVFPNYKVENFHIFYTEQEFSRYADSVKLSLEFEKSIEKKDLPQMFEICKCAFDMLKQFNEEFGDVFDEAREPHLERFTPNARYIHILSSGSKHLTTNFFGDVKEWFEYLISQKYCRHKRGEWYCHLALIYTFYLKDYEKAARLVITALEQEKDNLSEIQIHDLAHRGKVLNKKTYHVPPLLHDQIAALVPPTCERTWPQDVAECKSIKSQEAGRRRAYVQRCENGDTNYLTVEQTAMQYYRTLGFPNGEHCEGNLIIASFCLLFWNIIYEKYVKGTFTSNVQNAPLDMYTKYFFINREQWIKKRLQSIKENWSDEELKKMLYDNWNLHSHESSLCQLDAVVEGPERLYEVITCIGRPVLSKIYERLVKNFKAYHSGFPDLILWNPQEKKAKFVEVKSENDKLSMKQKLWLNYLMDIGASVAVCHIESKSSKRNLATSRN